MKNREDKIGVYERKISELNIIKSEKGRRELGKFRNKNGNLYP